MLFDRSVISHVPESVQDECQRLAEAVRTAGGRALLVGGCVRDGLLGYIAKDVDIEVFGLPADKLEALLRPRFPLDVVGRSFGVFKLKGQPIDVSLPRRESKTGTGHTGFQVEGDPGMAPAEAARRRDFTINAISADPLTGEIVDPLMGRADLEKRLLRHCSGQFAEDPLRVLRAMQFIARFELAVAPETLELCRSIEPEDLPPERLFEEWAKLFLKGVKPSRGLDFLKDSGWLKYYPELAALPGCPQDPRWHPEGDVWVHTLHCLDAFARERVGDDFEDLVVGLAVLLHDVGKPPTTFTDEAGRIRSPRHDSEGLPLAERFLQRITRHQKLIAAVLPLVETHMRPADLYKNHASDAAIRRLARKVRIDRLVRVANADMAGRPPKPADFPAGQWLLDRSRQLNVQENAPAPILQGRHLIARGFEPGRAFKPILDAAFEAQLDGEFADEASAQAWLDAYLRERDPVHRDGD